MFILNTKWCIELKLSVHVKNWVNVMKSEASDWNQCVFESKHSRQFIRFHAAFYGATNTESLTVCRFPVFAEEISLCLNSAAHLKFLFLSIKKRYNWTKTTETTEHYKTIQQEDTKDFVSDWRNVLRLTTPTALMLHNLLGNQRLLELFLYAFVCNAVNILHPTLRRAEKFLIF